MSYESQAIFNCRVRCLMCSPQVYWNDPIFNLANDLPWHIEESPNENILILDCKGAKYLKPLQINLHICEKLSESKLLFSQKHVMSSG